jgi:hypothetical protein
LSCFGFIWNESFPHRRFVIFSDTARQRALERALYEQQESTYDRRQKNNGPFKETSRREVRMYRSRLCAFFALVFAMLVPPPAIAAPTTTDPATITALAAEAYLWGLGPEYIERFSKYNTIIGAKFNAFKYGSVPAAWNNEATNAGDASVLYISGFVNFEESPELVLTVPPSRNQYYVVA